jgi:hypothetical protein
LAAAVNPGRILDWFIKSSLDEVTMLADGAIDGTEAWHLRIALDPAQDYIERMAASDIPEERAQLQEQIDSLRAAEVTIAFELWIGKADYLVRQLTWSMSLKAVRAEDEIAGIPVPEGAEYASTTTMRLFDFNEPIEIEAPTSLGDTLRPQEP